MIVTRTPMRISFVGGGTDVPAFYERHEAAVISMTIDKHVYIMLNPKFDGRFRVSYSKTENVDTWREIQHDIVREVMHQFGFKGMEVTSVSDIPGEGSGLGSSSAFTVGLLKAAYGYADVNRTAKMLAEDAFKLEAKICGHPVGKQDHYSAACGGLNHLTFKKNDVRLSTFGFLDEQYQMLCSNLMLFWTGISRKADAILTDQSDNFASRHETYEAGLLMTELVRELKEEFDRGSFDKLGRCVHAGWLLKKKFAEGISDHWIESAIQLALTAGADGAKICGAGGGGFLLVVSKPPYFTEIEKTLKPNLRRVPFKIQESGSTVIYREDVP